MKERALLLFILFLGLCCNSMSGQDLPSAEILTYDAAWCELSNNLTVAEILITGEIDTSRFDLVVSLRGSMDTLVNLPSGIFSLFLNNQLGRNEYIVYKVIEYQEYNTLENEVNDTLIMEVHPWPEMTFNAEYESLCSPVDIIFRAKEGYPSYTWDFGDGSGDVSRDPGEHSYNSWGIFLIEMLWFTPFCRDSITKQIEILPPEPVAAFSPDTSACPPLHISFINNTLYAESYQWDFDDGTFSTAENPSHTFHESGSYHVKLLATGLSGKDSTVQLITVFDLPLAMFESDITETNKLDQEITFINNSLDGVSYLWNFGDGSTSEEESPKHIFGHTVSYTITLYAWSSDGCTDTLVMDNMITILEGEGSTTFPNAFRWNGTGPTGGHWTPGSEDNTVFHPDVENAIELEMFIFSRLGHKVFETNEVYVGWDGYINSSYLAEQGVYIYKATITYSDGSQEVLTGDLTFLH